METEKRKVESSDDELIKPQAKNVQRPEIDNDDALIGKEKRS